MAVDYAATHLNLMQNGRNISSSAVNTSARLNAKCHKSSYGISKRCPIGPQLATDFQSTKEVYVELPYATNGNGEISSLTALSSIASVLTMVSKQQSHFQQRQR
jgi:hypothetical protein